jgi:hypothetical protein
VKLNDAIRHAEEAVKAMKGTDAAAVHSLIEVAKRVRRLQNPVRQLADAFAPHSPELNQVPLFEDDDGSKP